MAGNGGKLSHLGQSEEDEEKEVDSNDQKTIVGKFVKQQSLPEDSSERHLSWIACNSNLDNSNYSGMFLSPNASSNTLTGSMYTASEGMHTSRSGMTTYSGNADFYLTPQISSLASFQTSEISSLNQVVYYSCHSNLKLMLENENNEVLEKEKEDNEANESRLRDIEINSKDVKSHKESFKSKLLKGVYKRHSSKKKRSHEHNPDLNGQTNHKVQMVAKTDDNCVRTNTAPKVIHGILKSSVSSDSDSYRHGNRQSDNNVKLGGTKTLLIEKVR